MKSANLQRILVFVISCLLLIFCVINMTSHFLVNEWISVVLGSLSFILPGGLLGYLIAGGSKWSWVRFIGVGLPISIALIGIIGVIGRTLHWTIFDICIIWFLLSFILLSFAVLFHLDLTFDISELIGDRRKMFFLMSILLTIGVFIFIAPTTLKKANDILIYNAEVTHYANNQPLDWSEIYLDTGNSALDRFFLSYWTLGQALIVFVSGVHIFEAQLTIQSLLMIYTASAFYVTARLFNYSKLTSGLLVLLQLLIFAILQDNIGKELLTRVIQDKVFAGVSVSTLVLGVCFAIEQNRTRNNILLFCLIFLGLIFIHPIISGFLLGVILVWAIFSIIINRTLYPYIMILLWGAILFSPNFVLRITTDSEDFYEFGSDVESAPSWVKERLWISDDYRFYAPLPEEVHVLTYVLLILGFIANFPSMKHVPLSRIFIAYIIVVSVGLVPFTAWIYGKLISLSHINRIVWIFPYSFITWSILVSLNYKNLYKNQKNNYKVANWFGWGVFLIIIFLFSVKIRDRIEISDTERSILQIDKEMILVGEYFESISSNDDEIVVLSGGSRGFEELVPVATDVVIPVSFNDAQLMAMHTQISLDEAEKRRSRSSSFFSDGHDNEKRLLNLNRYEVNYIVYLKETGSQFVDPLMSEFPNMFQHVFETSLIAVVKYSP